jgi:hypothetical protein
MNPITRSNLHSQPSLARVVKAYGRVVLGGLRAPGIAIAVVTRKFSPREKRQEQIDDRRVDGPGATFAVPESLRTDS